MVLVCLCALAGQRKSCCLDALMSARGHDMPRGDVDDEIGVTRSFVNLPDEGMGRFASMILHCALQGRSVQQTWTFSASNLDVESDTLLR